MEIRSARPDDLDLVVDLRLAFLCDVRGLTDVSDAVRTSTREFFRALGEAGRVRTWIAGEGDEALGLVSVVLQDVPPLPDDLRCVEGLVINEFVRDGARGRGVGRGLLRAALAGAPELGIRRLRLFATEAGAPLYASEGFVVEGRHLVLTVPPTTPATPT